MAFSAAAQQHVAATGTPVCLDAAQSTLPPSGTPCDAIQASSDTWTCAGTAWSAPSDKCSGYETTQHGAACRAQLQQQSSSAQASALAATCAACEACYSGPNGDGCVKPCPACPVACMPLYPLCTPAPMFAGSSAGVGGTGQQGSMTLSAFMNTFMSQTGAVDLSANAYKLKSGVTAQQMQDAVYQGLVRNAECWWPALSETASAVAVAANGGAPAGGGSGGGAQPSSCDGLLLDAATRKKYAAFASTCPTTDAGVSCASAVRNAMHAVLTAAPGTSTFLTQTQLYSLCTACGFDAGLAAPVTFPSKQTAFHITLGVLGGVVVIAAVALLIKAQRSRRRQRGARAAAVPQ